jgi:hypothetical protein
VSIALVGRTGLRPNTTPDGYDQAEKAMRNIINIAGDKLYVCMYGNNQQNDVMKFYFQILKDNKVPVFYLPDNVYAAKYHNSKIDHHLNSDGHHIIAKVTALVLCLKKINI